MSAKKKKNRALVGQQKIKEVNRLIRSARSQWKAHNNTSSRRERQKALNLYETLDSSEKEKIPQVLLVKIGKVVEQIRKADEV